MNHLDRDELLDAALGALASGHRRRIVDLLATRPAPIAEVAAHVGLSLPGINRHLGLLERAELIQRRKTGRTTYLAIRRAGLRRVQDWLGGYAAYWGSDRETLDNFVDRIEKKTKEKR